MTTRIELNGDGWAELRDPATLTNGQRKPIIKMAGSLPIDSATGKPDLGGFASDAILEMGDKVVRAFLVDWSYGDLPAADDPDAFDNVLADDYDTLQIECSTLMLELVKEKPASGSVPTKS